MANNYPRGAIPKVVVDLTADEPKSEVVEPCHSKSNSIDIDESEAKKILSEDLLDEIFNTAEQPLSASKLESDRRSKPFYPSYIKGNPYLTHSSTSSNNFQGC